MALVTLSSTSFDFTTSGNWIIILASKSSASQSEGGFKSIAELYNETGLSNLSQGENAEIAGMERILEHWRDLDHREPTLKIVCPTTTRENVSACSMTDVRTCYGN